MYFSDGYLRKRTKSTHNLLFSLQGDEDDIVKRIVEMFRRSGLNPTIDTTRGKVNEYRVEVVATNILSFFPDKNEFLSLDASALKNWIVHEGLGGKLGVPFIAGLLDGDGSCRVESRSSIFGSIWMNWRFRQKKYPFLVDFLGQYINSLAVEGVSVSSKGGELTARILTSGRDALIKAEIMKWSSKVVGCLKKYEKLKRQISDLRSRFYTAAEVARRLKVDGSSVLKWCRLGYIKHLRIRNIPSRLRYCYIIPVEEVQRLELEVGMSKSGLGRLMTSKGHITVKQVAHALGVGYQSVYRFIKTGKLNDVPFSTLGGVKKHLIPAEEVDRYLREEINQRRYKD
nr:helix-turn-helix domain-containing protein [Candidatus Njordarchaeota archaeon]